MNYHQQKSRVIGGALGNDIFMLCPYTSTHPLKMSALPPLDIFCFLG